MRENLTVGQPRDLVGLREMVQTGDYADKALLHLVDTVIGREAEPRPPAVDGGQTLLIGSALVGRRSLANAMAYLSTFNLELTVHRSWATGILKDCGEFEEHARASAALIEALRKSRPTLLVVLDAEAMRLSETFGAEFELVPLPAFLVQSGVRLSAPPTSWLWDGTDKEDPWVLSLQQLLSHDIDRLPARFGPAGKPPILQKAPAKAHVTINKTKQDWLRERALVTANVLSQIRFPRARFYLDDLIAQTLT